MEGTNTRAEYIGVNNYGKLIMELRLKGNFYFPERDVKFWLESIQEFSPKKDLHFNDFKNLKYDSIEAYLTSYESHYRTNAIILTDDAIDEMLKAIHHICSFDNCLFSEAELCIIMFIQLIRIHCVSLSSKDLFDTPPRNFTVIIGNNEYWKGLRTYSARKVRTFCFSVREY